MASADLEGTFMAELAAEKQPEMDCKDASGAYPSFRPGPSD